MIGVAGHRPLGYVLVSIDVEETLPNFRIDILNILFEYDIELDCVLPRTESVNFTPLSLVFFYPYSNEERIKISNLMLQKDPNLSNYPPNKILCRSAFHFDNFEMFKYYL